ncbi:MAG: ArnT family glycosyltransferase [Acidimicrobiia bacterium]
MPSVSRDTRDALVVGGLALVVRIPAFFAPQPLGFDDGQFAMSVIAMRHGGLPFREVFSSQGPLFLPLAWLGDLVTFRRLDSPRAVSVAAGVALSVLVLLLARRLTARGPALLAAVLVACSGSVLWTSAPLTSDGIGEALAVATGLAAVAYWERAGWRRAVAVGLLAGAALAVKSLLVIPALAAAGIWMLLRRRPRDLVVVPAVAVATVLVCSVPWGLARVYDQYVRYHTDAVADRPIGANLHKLVSTLGSRDAPLLAAAAVALLVVLAGIAARRRARPPDESRPGAAEAAARPPSFPVVVWFLAVLAVVLTESPMWRNHVAHVAVPLALLVAIGLDRARRPASAVAVAAIVAVLLIPVSVVNLTELLRPQDPPPRVAALDHWLRQLPAGALVISDTPGLTWRAGRRAPDNFVDVSILRITSPTPSLRLTGSDIVRAARRPDVCAVIRWSDKRFTHFPDLGRRLRASGYTPQLRHHPEVLWVKDRCAPPGSARGSRTSAAAPSPRSRG